MDADSVPNSVRPAGPRGDGALSPRAVAGIAAVRLTRRALLILALLLSLGLWAGLWAAIASLASAMLG
jgi:hypothetical protein